MRRTYKRKLLRRKTKHRKRMRKNLKGGSFIETGSLFSHLLNNVVSTFNVPTPTNISFDPRVTNQFIYQK